MSVSSFSDIDLQNCDVAIESDDGSVIRLSLSKRAGRGMKGVTWKATNRYGRAYAVKFVDQSEYRDHSLEAEILQVNELGSRFAQIIQYGTPKFSNDLFQPDANGLYAVVVEWIDGMTLEEFCHKEEGSIDVTQFLQLAYKLCESLAILQKNGLSHSDLHEGNIMITEVRSGPNLEPELDLRIIDTGSLMKNAKLEELKDNWRSQVTTLAQFGISTKANEDVSKLKERIAWFSRSDQEWVVYHLCQLTNLLRRNSSDLSGAQRHFVKDIVAVLARMVDQDYSMRVDSAAEMYQQLDILWKRHHTPPISGLQTPFDLISAELIRNDNQLVKLFSDKCPWYNDCASSDPIYVYGPRGCGKSTILRMLSLPAVLANDNAARALENRSFIGVYLSCASELRSRFLLFPNDKFDEVEADSILFFTMLLTEALLETLELLRDGNIEKCLGESVGLTNDTAREICYRILKRYGLGHDSHKLMGSSWLIYAKKQIASARYALWNRMITTPQRRTPDPSLIFEICKDVEEVFPLLTAKKIAFLLDDYSNQRIPSELQRVLNKTISFAKHGNPIFKVSSEYLGVDLDGIHEGREVVEINLGYEYVTLTENERSRFLEDILDIRFRSASVATTVAELLGRSGMTPSVQMARAIRDGDGFYYHGIDTIADICSGDVAMALDLVKKIFESNGGRTGQISAKKQHEVITAYSENEHRYLWYYTPYGHQMSKIVDRLCWLAHEAACRLMSKKDGRDEPVIKTHLDISVNALFELFEKNSDKHLLLHEMQKKGVIFSLTTSRSRAQNNGTSRFQVRRILLVRYKSPLGRRDPIRIDSYQRLLLLLDDPELFANSELSVRVDPKQGKLELE